MRALMLVAGLAVLGGCDAVTSAVEDVGAKSDGSSDRLEAKSGYGMEFKGEFSVEDTTWAPTECVKTEFEGLTGMVFISEADGYALAVWTEGVPEGQSNVWFADMNQPPPPDDNFAIGKGRCGKLRTGDTTDIVNGKTKIGCDVVSGEVQFRNCPDATMGSAAASVKSWPPK